MGGVDNITSTTSTTTLRNATSKILIHDVSTIWRLWWRLHHFIWRRRVLWYKTKWPMSSESDRPVRASFLIKNNKMISSTGPFYSIEMDYFVQNEETLLSNLPCPIPVSNVRNTKFDILFSHFRNCHNNVKNSLALVWYSLVWRI